MADKQTHRVIISRTRTIVEEAEFDIETDDIDAFLAADDTTALLDNRAYCLKKYNEIDQRKAEFEIYQRAPEVVKPDYPLTPERLLAEDDGMTQTNNAMLAEYLTKIRA